MTNFRDHYLPPDPDAYRRAEPPTGRVIVIAPTRAACETIELAMQLDIETVLEREHGDEIRELAARGMTMTPPGVSAERCLRQRSHRCDHRPKEDHRCR